MYLLCVAVMCVTALFTAARETAPVVHKTNKAHTNNFTNSADVVANAGADTTLYKNQTRPDSIFLNGSASTPGQTYQWTQISGPSTAQIQTPDSLTSWVTGTLVEGFYQFQLTINGSVSDTMVAFLRDWQKRGIYPCRAGYDTVTKTGGLKITLEPNYKGTYIKPDGSSGTWNKWDFITNVQGYVQSTKKVTLSGGDTLLMEGADSTAWAELGGFGGSPGCPVYLMPHTKPIRIRGTGAFFRIAIRDSNVAQYVVVDGTGLRNAGYPYGFVFDNSGIGYAGTSFTGGWVANFTIKGFHSVKTNAFKIKQDPTVRPYSRYDKWIQRNILITDNWLDSSSAEGMYIGSTAPDGGQTAYGWPIRMENVSVINNIVSNTKWDAIQLSNTKSGSVIKHNLVYKAGTANQPSQRAGILLGGNTTGVVDSNLVINSKGDGIQVFGYDAVNVYNNIIDSIYGGSGDQDGMYQSFIDFVSEPNNVPLSIFNYGNLISRVERNMIRVANNNGQMLPGRTHHNTFVHPTATDANSLIVTNVKGDQLDNNSIVPNFPYTLNTIGTKDTVSISITQGDTTQVFITPKAALVWLFGRLKSVANNVPPVVNAGADTSILLPLDSVFLHGQAYDADGGSLVRYQWTKLSGPDSGTIVIPSAAQTWVKNLSEGTYAFQLAATDNGGLTAQDTIQVTVLPPPNLPPVANAGSDQLITLPVNSVTLNGTATDTDGTIASTRWTKIAGPTSGTIQNGSALQTTVTGLQHGIYDFELQATDNRNGTAADTVRITVNAPPVVNAGNDQTITLPANRVTLQGNATDSDGTIASMVWTKISGPASYRFGDSLNTTTTVDTLLEGTYLFTLNATDDQGGSTSDTVRITVLPMANAAPTANAGTDQTITLPTSTVTLNGSGTDSDGSIASYAWSKTSGPTGGTITNPAAASTTVTGLVAGSYVFHLVVTDNKGGTGSDDVTVTVNSAPATTKTINVNIYGGSNAYSNSAWNNWNVGSGSGTNKTSSTFKYSDGTTSKVTAVLSNTTAVKDNGSSYGSGIAPAQVLRYTSYYTSTRSLTLKGLSTSKKYSIELYASRNVSGSSTIFKVNGLSQTIATYNNLTKKATFTNLSPNTSGQLVISISKSGSYNCINGFALTETTGTTASITAADAMPVMEVPQEPEAATVLELYPNPAADNVTFRLNTAHTGTLLASVANAAGRIVVHTQFDKVQPVAQYTIPLSQLPAGIYFIHLQIGNWTITRKLVKL